MNWKIPSLVPLVLLVLSPAANANIYQWAWKNPANPSQGKIASTTVCPGGSGVTAGTTMNLSGLDLTQAYLSAAILDSTNFTGTNLTNAYMAHSAGLRQPDRSEPDRGGHHGVHLPNGDGADVEPGHLHGQLPVRRFFRHHL